MVKNSHSSGSNKKFYPFVSVCTPTFNRRPFIPIMFQCFLNQDYPKDRMEWIIVDDGTDCIQDLIDKSGISQIKYFRQDKKMSLGEKRNYMHSKAKGSIIVYMDDDDYYPIERVSHSVDTLMNNKHALCAGSSEIYIYFKHIKKMYQSGPYGPNHATAGTFAFKAELLKHTSYENDAALAEEKHFLKEYTVPFVQLDPLKTILVFSHEHNTFDKRKLLENQHPDYFKESNKTIDQFIRNTKEESIKRFFVQDIDGLLKTYKPGEPSMKPDVLAQIKKIEEQRKKMVQEQGESQVMINEEGKPPRAISQNEIIELMNKQMEEIKTLSQKNQVLETMVANLQKKIAQNATPKEVEKLKEVEKPKELEKPKEGEKPKELEKPKEVEKPKEQLNKTVFTDILLAKISELENQVTFLQSSLSKNNESINVVTNEDKKILNIKPIEIRSKSMPEVKVNIL